MKFIREEKCENEKIKIKRDERNKVNIYVRWSFAGDLGCSGLEISQPTIQPDPLNYLSNLPDPTQPASFNGPVWVGLGRCGLLGQADFLHNPIC